MPAGRMLLPLVAPGSLLLLALSLRLPSNKGLLILAFAVFATFVQSLARPAQPPDLAAFIGGIVGHHIDATWPTDITIAVNTAGSTPFYAGGDRVFIDMLGLNDPTIAHREDVPALTQLQQLPGHGKGDGAYVLSRAPDRIIVGPSEGTDIATPWFLTDYELGRNPEFAECYSKVVETISVSESPTGQALVNPGELVLTYYDRVCD